MMKYYLVISFLLLSIMSFSQECDVWNTDYSYILNHTKGVKCLDENNNPCIMNRLTVDNNIGTTIYYFEKDKLIQVSRIVYDEDSFNALLDLQYSCKEPMIISRNDKEYRIDILSLHRISGILRQKYIPALPDLKKEDK